MENYKLDEFKARLAYDVNRVTNGTLIPDVDSPAYVYYIRMQEILDVLKRAGVEVK